MALSKEIELDNGIVTKYHRINSIQQMINKQTIIEVNSYISREKREEEIQAYTTAQEAGNFPEMNVFIDADFITKEYEDGESIEDAYNYLKTLDKFKGAKDC